MSTETEEMQHHPMGASKHPMWSVCACFDNKDDVGPAAIRGTIQHKALECLLKNVPYPLNDPPLTEDEMTAVLWAWKWIKDNTHGMTLRCEVTMEYFDKPDDFEPLFFSTLDVEAISKDGKSAMIFDYKSGEDHGYDYQMASYAAMVCQKYNLDEVNVFLLFGKLQKPHGIKFTRAKAEEMLRWVLARRADPDKKPNPCDYCGWCKHAATCPPLNEAALTVVAGREDWKLETFHASEITKPAEMSKALTMARLVKSWAEAVEHHAKELAIKKGEKIPGFKVTKRSGVRVVSNPSMAFKIADLSALEFIDLCCTVRVTDLEKKIGKKEFAEKFEPVLSRNADSMFLTAEKE